MTKLTTGANLADIAARHHSTLNGFAAVTAILEGGLIYDHNEQKTVEKILKLCQEARQRQLCKYDAAINLIARRSALKEAE